MKKRGTPALTSAINFNFCPKSKRSELTTQQIVVIIILIISFVVILFLLWRLNLGETSNKEICHNSVVMAGKNKGLLGSLDCKTTYVCISGGDDCNEFVPTATLDINLNKDDAENKIKEAVQTEIDDCWWMFGEGKIDYLGLDVSGYRCAICSTIKFDKKIQEKFSQIAFNEQMILTSEKYLIITGMDSTLVGKDKYISPIIVKSEDIDLMNFKCERFFTKA